MKELVALMVTGSLCAAETGEAGGGPEGLGAEGLSPDRKVVSMSAVKGKFAHTRFLWIENGSGEKLETPSEIRGPDAEAFEVIDAPEDLGPGTKGRWTLAFRTMKEECFHEAELRVGSGEDVVEVPLRGLGQREFEGGHEPPLQEIVRAFGIPLDVGGDGLEMSTDEETIGDSVAASYFRRAGEGKVRVTPLARYSPEGEVPFGVFREGVGELEELGRMAKSSGVFQDAHQALFPPLAGDAEAVEFEAGDEPFGFFLKGHFYVSFTDPGRESEGKKVRHAARIYPVEEFQGAEREDVWLVGFEEATNGDYQDLVLMVENVRPVISGEAGGESCVDGAR